MNGLYTGLTGLRAAQAGLDVTSQNIANSASEGYHRRDIILAQKVVSNLGDAGTGVSIESIRRLRSRVTEELITDNTSGRAFAEARLETLNSLETMLAPGAGSLHDRLSQFFSSLEELSARSGDRALQRLVVERGGQLTGQLNQISSQLAQLRGSIDLQIETVIEEFNQNADRAANLQFDLLRKPGEGESVNLTREELERVVNRLADSVDVQVDTPRKGHSLVRFANGTGIIGQKPPTLYFATEGEFGVVRAEGYSDSLRPGSGRLAGLISSRNEILLDFEQALDGIAQDLSTAIDGVHAEGIGDAGAFETMMGVRSVVDPNVPLEESSGSFPVTDGQLHVYVSDTATGDGELHRIDVDVSVDSLTDVAGRIDAIPNIETLVNNNGHLAISAKAGFEFDFTGRVATIPDRSLVTGTSDIRLAGRYAGAENDTWRFEVSGSGQIGQPAGLFVDVRDSAGGLIKRLDLGRGYEPGSSIEVDSGVFVTFGPGDLNAGDEFSTDVVAKSDTTGLLVALGMNTFFEGATASSLTLSQDLTDDPSRFAAGISGELGDSTNLNRMIAVRTTRISSEGSRTLEQSLGDLTAFIGADTELANGVTRNLELAHDQLFKDRESVSGVDPNEELVRMLAFQRQFQASSTVIATMRSTFDELFRIV